MTDPLIHIGYHKTGSTWLQEKIFSDARLGFVKPRTPLAIDEAFVVTNPFAFDGARTASEFASLFAEAERARAVPVISHERLSGDIDTGGIDSRAIADRLVEAFPSARVLIVIREQREMLLSVYKTDIRFSPVTLEEKWRERTVTQRRHASPTLEYFEYHHQIAYYQQLFGPERVLVLPFEALHADPLAFVSQITKFAGLSAPTSVPDELANRSLPSALLAVNRWFNLLMVRIVGASAWAHDPLEDRKLKRGHLRVLRKASPIMPRALSRSVENGWRKRIERIVGDRFAYSNRITSDLTGLDLASLGYRVTPRSG